MGLNLNFMEKSKIKNKKISEEIVISSEKESKKIESLGDEKDNPEDLSKVILEADYDLEDKGEKKTKKDKEIEAIVHVYTSYNNTIVHVTDMSGRTIIKISGGMVTKHNRLKANPTIAMFISKRISEKMKEEKIKNLYLRVRAKTGNPTPGPGANALVKSLSREGFKIINILDNTRIARGGPKKKGGRRGRRP